MILPVTDIKILIAYFSRRGKNYMDGKVVTLEVGNTEVLAHKIQQLMGGDLFEIRTLQEYPEEYIDTTRVARNELRTNARPELAEYVKNMEDYDVVYLGYPNWWGTFPMAVCTFLESADFSGKTIIPFCTHEGSGMCGERNIHKLCPTAQVEKGLAIAGSRVKEALSGCKTYYRHCHTGWKSCLSRQATGGMASENDIVI
jgi:flavodoxin